MDFYKKIIKNRDISAILSEKEYKCASLQAITSESVKENNKELVKDLAEEINGHLTELRSLKDDKDPKNKEKCEKLIGQFESCLVKILNKKPSDNVLIVLHQRLEELQHLSRLAIQEGKNEELQKLVERIEINLTVLKEMPEVKNAKNVDKNGEYLKLLSKYEDLLRLIKDDLSAKKRVISEPMAAEVFSKVLQGSSKEEESHPPPKPARVGLNEVEEKLRLMRQKRLNRLSTFVDQQSKLSEQRSRENSPKNLENSYQNDGKVSEIVANKTAIKSIQSKEILKPPSFKEIVLEKVLTTTEQKVKSDEKYIKRTEQHLKTNDFQGKNTTVSATFKNGSFKGGTSSSLGEKKQGDNVVLTGTTPTKEIEEQKFKIQEKISRDSSLENITSKNETLVSRTRSSFGKGTLTRSFAERQIENAKMQALSEKPKVQLKPSNSSRTTPPRTPTQIRKIFNSFNACVLGSNNTKSIEDVSKEFNSPFEQELKTVKLKPTNFENRLEQVKEKETHNLKTNSEEIKNTESIRTAPVVPPETPKQVPSRDMSVLESSRGLKQNENDTQLKSFENKRLYKEEVGFLEANLLQGEAVKTSSENYDLIKSTENINVPDIVKAKRRLSLDFDSLIEPKQESSYVHEQSTDLIITVKRNSNNVPLEPDRYLFKTFRASIDSPKIPDTNSIENPLYDVVNADSIEAMEYPKKNKNVDPIKYSTYEKILKDLVNKCQSVETLLKPLTEKEKENVSNFDEIKEINLILKEVKRKVQDTLNNGEKGKEDNKFARLLQEIYIVENIINKFKGFKRDPEYSLIDKQLAKYYVEIDQIRSQSPNDISKKKYLTERLKMANKDLEEIVNRNEKILKTVLEEQAAFLAEKYRIA